MSKLLPYETIVKAHEGDPEAVNAVLRHYTGYIRYFSKVPAPLRRIYPLFLQSERTGQCRGGGLCETATN